MNDLFRDMDFIQPFLIGFLGSFHCLGMCGPIVFSLPLKERSLFTKLASGLLYNAGRVFTYSLLGMALGFLGLGFHIWGIQQWISVAIGAIMILSVGFPLLVNGSSFSGWLDKRLAGFRRLFGRFFGLRSYFSILAIGLLNGLLPCGLVYIALAGALVSRTPLSGSLYMFAFGLGTMPALFGLSYLGNTLNITIRRRMKGFIPYLVLFVGILFVLRGMNLGIPYLSPKMEQAGKVKTEQFQKPECCHSK